MRTGRRETGRRCLAEGCERRVRAGKALCRGHERGADGRAVEEAVGKLARRVEGLAVATAPPAPQSWGEKGGVAVRRPGRATDDARGRAEAAFRRAVERGEYGGLFDGRLREVMGQAVAEKGVAEELGALRVMLGRLLSLEGEDPLRVAHGVARVADVALRARRAEQALAGDDSDEVTRAFLKAAREMDAEAAAARANGIDPWAADEDEGWDGGWSEEGGLVGGEWDGLVVREGRDPTAWEDGA